MHWVVFRNTFRSTKVIKYEHLISNVSFSKYSSFVVLLCNAFINKNFLVIEMSDHQIIVYDQQREGDKHYYWIVSRRQLNNQQFSVDYYKVSKTVLFDITLLGKDVSFAALGALGLL